MRLGLRPQGSRVRAGLCLGQRERAEMLAARERRHEPRLLLVGAVREDRQGRGTRVDGDGHTDSGIGARQLFEHEDVRQEVDAGAAVLLGYARTHQADLRELSEELTRKVVVAIPGGRIRLDLRAREIARQRLDLALVLRQIEVHAGKS